MQTGRHPARPTCIALASLGWCAVGFAIAGLLIPGLPSTVFVLAASYCFSRSSPRFSAWLHRHRWFGPTLARLARDGGMPRAAKRSALWALWAGIGVSTLMLWGRHPVGALLTAGLGVLGSAAILFAVRTVPESLTSAPEGLSGLRDEASQH